MTVYAILQADITDLDRYESYKPLAAASVAEHGGSYLVRGGNVVSLEGSPPRARTVILEFDSMDAAKRFHTCAWRRPLSRIPRSLDAAKRWYESASYSEARPIRQAASEGSLYLVEA